MKSPMKSPTKPPKKSPTKSPAIRPTKTLTKPPTNQPTNQPTTPRTALGSIRGFAWDDTPTGDALYSAGDSPLPSVSISLHRCSDDVLVGSATTLADGTFALVGLGEGPYRVRAVLPGGRSIFADGGAGRRRWEFVARNAGGAAGSAAAEGSDVYEDGSSDCMVVASGRANGSLWHSMYVGLTRRHKHADDDARITVSGTIFWDSEGGSVLDDETASELVVGGIVVDLYDCVNLGNPRWIMLTRTDSAGRYVFTVPQLGSDGTTNDLAEFLEGRGVKKFNARVSLPSSSSSGYVFSSRLQNSDVDPEDGTTPCWDIEEDGRGPVVWDAGITSSPKSKMVPTGVTTTASTLRRSPAKQRPTVESMSAGQTTTSSFDVGGYAFLDSNDDGARDPNPALEPIVTNVSMWLFSCSPPPSALGFLSSGGSSSPSLLHSKSNIVDDEELLATQRPNAQGFYSFRDLSSGYYRVNVRLPPGYRVSSAWLESVGISMAVEISANPETLSTKCFQLEGSDADISWDVGLVRTQEPPTRMPTVAPSPSVPVVISGFVFHDINNNGRLEEGEGAIPNVQTALFDCDGSIQLLSNTDNNGVYGFEGVSPGSYVVKFSSPGYRISDMWTGMVDEAGKLATPEAENEADPQTGSTACRKYEAGDKVHLLGAGMIITERTPAAPTPAVGLAAAAAIDGPTADPRGDGTRCSGGPCPVEGMCRNQAGLCGDGIGFCNPNNVWDSSCSSSPDLVTPAAEYANVTLGPAPLLSLAPSRSPSPNAVPTLTASPTLPIGPSHPISVTADDTFDVPSTVCNDDGSVGLTDGNSFSMSQGAEISFAYTLQGTGTTDVDSSLIDAFESELHSRLTCIYFDDPCLACVSRRASLRGRKTANVGRPSARQVQTIMDAKDSSVVGISLLPWDWPNPIEACAGGSSYSPSCRVIDGKFTAYFPQNMDPVLLERETNAILGTVRKELDKDDWKGRMKVSYIDVPFPERKPVNAGDGDVDGNGGPSAGAIAGIVAGVVVLIAIVAMATILFVRKWREKEEQDFLELQQQLRHQQRAAVVFFMGAGGLFGQKDGADKYAPNSEKDDSSSGGSSSLSEEENEDELGSVSGSHPSAISGDSFLANAAQAGPQDIAGEKEFYNAGSSDITIFSPGVTSNTPRLQQSLASDENCVVYEQDHVGGGFNMGGKYVRDYDATEDHTRHDPGNHNGLVEAEHDDDQCNDGQMREANHHHQDNFNGKDARSVISVDPPGTFCRDLDQEDNCDGIGMGEMPPQQPMKADSMIPVSGSGKQYVDESSQASFHVYESDGSKVLKDSYHSNVHENDAHSDPGSYHSNQNGSHSTHSQDSEHSVHSNPSAHSQGNWHSTNSDRSSHSQEDENQQQDYSQYMEEGHFHESDVDHSHYVDNVVDGHHNHHNMPWRPYGHEYDQHPMDGHGSSCAYADASYLMTGETKFVDAMGTAGGNQCGSILARNEGTHGNKYNGRVISFGENSYHSIDPVPSSNIAALSHPTKLDELSHVSATYTAATYGMPHISSHTVPPKMKKASLPKKEATSTGSPGGQKTYGDEEESITEIFKSLSEIQTRLASKRGKR